MQSSTKNVRLGVCRAKFDGDDLGVTQGGVEVTVTTETHEVMVDQMGKTPINEYIMGRKLVVKVPMAETTLENLMKIMPGATMTAIGGAKATGTITVATNPVANDTVTVNGVQFKFVAAYSNPQKQTEVKIGASAAATAAELATVLNNATMPAGPSLADYTVAAAIVTATYEGYGVEGNAFTLAAGQASITVSGATLTGGVAPTSYSVAVDHGIGQDLLATAKELRLHPTSRPDTDKSDDFIIPLANTSGALSFAYKLDQERIFNVEFKGYPDPTSGRLFLVGDNS
jgi:hypothetical protein